MPFQMREGTQQNAIDRVKCTELLQLAQKSNHLGLQTAAGFQKQNFSLQVWKIPGTGKLEQTTDVAAHNDAFHLIPLYKGIGKGKQGIPLFRLIMADLIQHAGIAGHGIDVNARTGERDGSGFRFSHALGASAALAVAMNSVHPVSGMRWISRRRSIRSSSETGSTQLGSMQAGETGFSSAVVMALEISE